MNKQLLIQLLVFIAMMFSVSFLQAQCKGNKVWIWYTCGRQICYKCVPRSQLPGFKSQGLEVAYNNGGILNNKKNPLTLSFSLGQSEKISTKIYDLTGRLVQTLTDKIFEQGDHELQWDAAGVNAGIYMVRFNAGPYSEMKKIAVIN